MQKALTSFSIILIGCLMFSSCATLYIPNRHQIACYEEKGDAAISFGVGVNNIDLQASYAVSDDIYLGISNCIGTNLFNSNSDEQFFYQIGLQSGYKLRQSNLFEHNIGVDCAWGYTYSEFEDRFLSLSKEGFSEGNYLRYSLQYVAIKTFEKHENSKLYFSNRFSLVDGFRVRNEPTGNYFKKQAFYLEPVIGFDFGFKKVKLTMQLGYTIPTNKEVYDNYFKPRSVIFSSGFTLFFKDRNLN